MTEEFKKNNGKNGSNGTNDLSFEDLKKVKTLVDIQTEILSLNEDRDAEFRLNVAKNIDKLLEGYSEEEVGHFAQCISGKRRTLPVQILYLVYNLTKSTSPEGINKKSTF